MQTASTQNQCTQHQSITNAHSIRLFSVGFSSLKTFTLRSMPPTLSFCAEPKAKSQNPSSQKIILALRERGDRRRQWVRARKNHFLPPLIRLVCIFSRGRRFSFAYWTVDSATPGKPCVQNDMRERREIGRRNQFIKVCSSKRHKMNCLCSLSKTWINQKSIYLGSIQSRYIQHQPNTNAHYINP